jgi:TrmH family RNA methyltransferase
VISSISNPRVQAARRLLRKRDRAAAGSFLIEGPNAVSDALDADWTIDEVFWTGDHPLVTSIEARGISSVEVSEQVMRALTDSSSPQGLVAVAGIAAADLSTIRPVSGLALVLAEIRDPGNAGTLLRSAVAAGCDVVVFTTGSVDPWSPKVVRSAAGATFKVPVASDVSAQDALAALSSAGYGLVGAAAGEGEDLHQSDLTDPVALVLGNESWGLSDRVEGLVDRKLTIPMPGGAESLNVAVAGSIILFEALRQRR